MIKGVSITLKKKTASGTDPFNNSTYTTQNVTVDNVLVGVPSADDINDAFTRYGKKAVYTLHIPKGDTNIWEDTEVVLPEPFAGTYRTIGYPTAYIQGNVPPGVPWNKIIKVERSQNG